MLMDCILANRTESDNMTFENTLAIAKITDECRKKRIGKVHDKIKTCALSIVE